MSDHEKTDAKIELIPWVIVAFVATMIVIFVSVWWIFRFYRSIDMSRDERRTFIQPPASVAIPPEPRLQVDPEKDLQRYREEQMRLLDSYGWASPGEQRVRIPIARAMELFAEQRQP